MIPVSFYKRAKKYFNGQSQAAQTPHVSSLEFEFYKRMYQKKQNAI